jgi:hypothetical protein
VTRIDALVDRDLQFLDLVYLFPGASIGDLARMSGESHGVAQAHIRVLMQARLVAVYSTYGATGHLSRIVYPAGVDK